MWWCRFTPHSNRGAYVYLPKELLKKLGLKRRGWFVATVVDWEKKQILLHSYTPDLRSFEPKKRVVDFSNSGDEK